MFIMPSFNWFRCNRKDGILKQIVCRMRPVESSRPKLFTRRRPPAENGRSRAERPRKRPRAENAGQPDENKNKKPDAPSGHPVLSDRSADYLRYTFV